MSDVPEENQQAAASGTLAAAETDATLLSIQMQENVEKTSRLVAGLHQEMSRFIEERDVICQQLQEATVNYGTVLAKLKKHTQSMELIVTEFQQKTLDLEREREELKRAMGNQEVVAVEDTQELKGELNTLRSELDHLNTHLDIMTESITCRICLLPWEREGYHRVVSLRCGHLYGCGCIRESLLYMHNCPICMVPASPSEVRDVPYGLGN